MSLADRFKQPGLDEGIVAIPVHQFSAMIRLWARGKMNKVDVIGAFSVTVSEQVQLDQLVSVYLSKAAGVERSDYLADIEATLSLLERGIITKTQAGSFLELT